MAVDYFLVLDGVTGETTDGNMKGAIALQSFSYGVSNTTTIGSATGGAGGGKASFDHFTITKSVDSASTVIFQNCASGKHYKKATLTCRKAGGDTSKPGQEYFVVDFGTVFVVGYQHAGSSGDDAPQETITFAYGAVKETYKSQKPDGTLSGKVEFGWSQIKNMQSTDVTAV